MDGPDYDEPAEPADDDECVVPVLRDPPRSRLTDPRLRQMEHPKAAAEPAWWVGMSRKDFADKAAERAAELRTSPEAAKVKTPLNFVGGMN